MPYVICASCRLSTYSAPLWAHTEVCPRCGTELERRRGRVVPLSDHPRFVSKRQGLEERRRGRDPEALDE